MVSLEGERQDAIKPVGVVVRLIQKLHGPGWVGVYHEGIGRARARVFNTWRGAYQVIMVKLCSYSFWISITYQKGTCVSSNPLSLSYYSRRYGSARTHVHKKGVFVLLPAIWTDFCIMASDLD